MYLCLFLLGNGKELTVKGAPQNVVFQMGFVLAGVLGGSFLLVFLGVVSSIRSGNGETMSDLLMFEGGRTGKMKVMSRCVVEYERWVASPERAFNVRCLC